jgi:hypothetical protein
VRFGANASGADGRRARYRTSWWLLHKGSALEESPTSDAAETATLRSAVAWRRGLEPALEFPTAAGAVAGFVQQPPRKATAADYS